MERRDFFKYLSATGAALAVNPVLKAAEGSPLFNSQQSIETNIADAVKIPRVKNSMPGLYPGRVVRTVNEKSVIDGVPQEDAAYEMLRVSMLALTGEKSLKKAWRKFVSPKDIIGLKVNPVAGRLLTTSHAVTKSVIKQLEESGIPRENIVIWDRRRSEERRVGKEWRSGWSA